MLCFFCRNHNLVILPMVCFKGEGGEGKGEKKKGEDQG